MIGSGWVFEKTVRSLIQVNKVIKECGVLKELKQILVTS